MSICCTCTVCWILCMYLRAELTPVSTLYTRLIICILYMDKTRLRDLPSITWVMGGGARIISDLLSPTRLIFYSLLGRSRESRISLGRKPGCSMGKIKSSHTWSWERTQRQAEEKRRDLTESLAS